VRCDLVAGFVGVLESGLLVVDTSWQRLEYAFEVVDSRGERYTVEST
jgi:ribosome biogenesis protein Tsr3